MLAVTGRRSTIIEALLPLLPQGEAVERIPMDTGDAGVVLKLPKADRFVLAAGVLPGKSLHIYEPKDAALVFAVNLLNPMRICEWVLATNPAARICIIGSESARQGSFDRLYAATKAGLHAYVQTRLVSAQQQLVAVSPCIIRDSGMTSRREDLKQVLETRRTCTALDVARAVHRVLYRPIEAAPKNVVLPINGKVVGAVAS